MIVAIDRWIHLSSEDIHRLELECMEELEQRIHSSTRSQEYSMGL